MQNKVERGNRLISERRGLRQEEGVTSKYVPVEKNDKHDEENKGWS